jgi:Rps23 Pro-64 3,4-dihydroxylase Tpa1-like proline 4-hydroxylase
LRRGHFYHRSAFRGCIYEKQTQSHKNRRWRKFYDKILEAEKAAEDTYEKNFKTTYAGQPTKRYLQMLKKIRQSEQLANTHIGLFI